MAEAAWSGVIGSANPHDASGADSNVAARVAGPVLSSLLESELEIARFSGWQGSITPPPITPEAAQASSGRHHRPHSGKSARVQVLTEGAIQQSLIERIDGAVKGDSIDIAMFYVADRSVVDSLAGGQPARRECAAHPRSQQGRLRPDHLRPAESAGGERAGLRKRRRDPRALVSHPRRAVSYKTGDDLRTRAALAHTRLGESHAAQSRGLQPARPTSPSRLPAARRSPSQTLDYFDTLWSNRASLGIEYTADFAAYADPGQGHYWLYRFLEGTGMSDF